MAEHLARIIGTEEDRVNCPFYWKIGACRHGDQCSRSHYKPTSSPTVVLRHMYPNPPVAVAIAEGQNVSDELLDQAADHFEAFYAEVFEELAKYGEIEDMVVCDNIGDHIIGNVYVKYTDEESANKALACLQGRFYSGKQIHAEFTPVTDFREARCRQFVDGQCRRGGYCNFMHLKHVPRSVKRKLFRKMYEDHPEYGRKRSPGRRRSRSRERSMSPAGRQLRRRSPSIQRPERQTSEERRAMIARWNSEREEGGKG
ncbi:u2 snrnp auxiliary factor small [Cystoisospora suis]|uniref:U2 snrnp auxiliary factor small n=1 Tax=Cystoisospora suis TaxID=483139 RepID=A0A2C6KXC2_9APIC|nr:u2 snrnp auxiliary factor small [Cystoisospora suis]